MIFFYFWQISWEAIAVILALVRKLYDGLPLVTQQFYRVLLRNSEVYFTQNKGNKAGFRH